MHLAGVPTAIATCGTAFGGDHIQVIRRLLMDQDEFRGEVIFTFDGDEAGQRSEEHTSELQSRQYLVCRLLLEKKKTRVTITHSSLKKYKSLRLVLRTHIR